MRLAAAVLVLVALVVPATAGSSAGGPFTLTLSGPAPLLGKRDAPKVIADTAYRGSSGYAFGTLEISARGGTIAQQRGGSQCDRRDGVISCQISGLAPGASMPCSFLVTALRSPQLEVDARFSGVVKPGDPPHVLHAVLWRKVVPYVVHR